MVTSISHTGMCGYLLSLHGHFKNLAYGRECQKFILRPFLSLTFFYKQYKSLIIIVILEAVEKCRFCPSFNKLRS